MFEPKNLLKLATTQMPFGKYKGWILIDLPEPYLVWFSGQGFPPGQLGELLQLALEIKINGLEKLVYPLKKATSQKK
ncbi:DUF3820 family protein [Aliikangiella sp. G2MR2-5]|uniref:DUF3820 family protein n=1 Tax=Aliikangiella sp. G2MR2-5 TaxID=2788943 RepID=UPI0018AAC3FD|nr:DUF3820 family protein [Aliikangiella sp. G2MR2-5]